MKKSFDNYWEQVHSRTGDNILQNMLFVLLQGIIIIRTEKKYVY